MRFLTDQERERLKVRNRPNIMMLPNQLTLEEREKNYVRNKIISHISNKTLSLAQLNAIQKIIENT